MSFFCTAFSSDFPCYFFGEFGVVLWVHKKDAQRRGVEIFPNVHKTVQPLFTWQLNWKNDAKTTWQVFGAAHDKRGLIVFREN